MESKTVLVTGANQGIGKATAIALAQQGAHVVILSRNPEKGRAALQDIQAASRGRKAELLVADFASLTDVRRAAAEFRASHNRLDVLVNNAGLIVPERHVTGDGIEETFQVNHLAPFLLTNELLDLLKASGPARIVNVSSEAHRHATMHWEDLGFAHSRYKAFRAYGQSKLANILFTYELARRLEGSGVTANVLHPGVVASGFGQTYSGALSFVISLAKPFMLTNEQGARTSVHVASSPEVEGVTGKYFSKCHPVRSNAVSYDQASQRKLWSLSIEMIKAPAQAAA